MESQRGKKESAQPERSHLRRVLMQNGYSPMECKKLFSAPASKRNGFTPPVASIPYVPRVSEKLKHLLSSFDINVALRPSNTLRSLLVKKRPSPSLCLGSVYHIPCSEPGCSFSYVGESSRPLEKRGKEHVRAIRQLDVDRSELAKHVHETGHSIPIDGMKRLCKEENWKRRITKEALWTRKCKSTNKVKIDIGRFYDSIL